MKNFWKKIVVVAMVMVLCLTDFAVMGVEAASKNKALAFEYSFKNMTYEKDGGDKCSYNNNYTIVLAGTNKKTAIKNLKLGGTVYIPKKALKKKNSVVDINMYLDAIKSNGVYYANISGRYLTSVVNENGKIKLHVWDEKKQKEAKASSFATCKSGNGTYKDYYIVTLKNISLMDEMYLVDNGGKEEYKKITSKTKYALNLGMNICGQGYKTSGTMYIDNLTVKNGSKKIVNQDFTKKPEWYEVHNKDKQLSSKKVKIKSF